MRKSCAEEAWLRNLQQPIQSQNQRREMEEKDQTILEIEDILVYTLETRHHGKGHKGRNEVLRIFYHSFKNEKW